MIAFVVGLALFLGLHSIRIVAAPMRTRLIDRLGANGWKGVYSIVSIASFVLLVWGYTHARMTTSFVWHPPTPMRHIAALLTLVSFVIFAAAYVPKNHIKARLHHPMTLGIISLNQHSKRAVAACPRLALLLEEMPKTAR